MAMLIFSSWMFVQLVDKDAHSVKEHSMDELRPCIEALHLTKEQKATLLHMRADHLTRMRGLYVDRQKLNMQVSYINVYQQSAC